MARSSKDQTIRIGLAAAVLLCAAVTACATRSADRSHAVYGVVAFAGLNNPNLATGDEDNLAAGAGARICVGPVSLRSDVLAGDLSVQFTPSVTWDFAIAGAGDGAIDGNVGVGYTASTDRSNNVLGNHASPFVRAGTEGYLVGGLLVGAALMAAPWGYDAEDLALAGVTYVGWRF